MPVTLKTRVCCFLTLEPSICPLRVGAENIQLSALPAIRLLVIAVTRGVIGIRRRAALVLQTNAVNPVSLTIISRSSTSIDDSETVIAVAPAVKSVNETIVSAREMIIEEPATIISKGETVISAPDAVMSGPHIIIYRSDAIMSALETVICAAETSISRAEIAISAFGTSFLAAEISISGAAKTTGAAPAGLFPIASQPSTNRPAFVLMAEVRPGGQS